MKKNTVAVVMGSESDMPQMDKALEVLKEFGIGAEVRVLSAHRSPDETVRFAKGAVRRGIKVIIAGAGGAAHLAGVIASHTTLPVIGVPMESNPLSGLDSLLSTVQMPPGIPVGTVAIGGAGAANAALLAVRILALSDVSARRHLEEHRKRLRDKVKAANERIGKKNRC